MIEASTREEWDKEVFAKKSVKTKIPTRLSPMGIVISGKNSELYCLHQLQTFKTFLYGFEVHWDQGMVACWKRFL
jgi:hypothetical protein